jgi:hypothetical protein
LLLDKLLAAGQPLRNVADGAFYRGVLTGLNDAFIIDDATRRQLISEHPGSADLLKPVLRGEDLRPWYQEYEGRWLIFTRRGTNIDGYPAIRRHLEAFRAALEPRPVDLDRSAPWAGRKQGAYEWFEIQDQTEYYTAFDGPKIFWPDIAKLPRFSFGDPGMFIANTGYVLPNAQPYLLGLLQSRVLWYCISQICQPLRLRAGLWQYRVIRQFVERLPIPEAGETQRNDIGNAAVAATAEARARYALHRKARSRILTDLGRPDRNLGEKLSSWWLLDFPSFRADVRRVFGNDVPVHDRDDWEEWLRLQKAEHERLTDRLVSLEVGLNDLVYKLFRLTADEINIVEENTKYPYGEV